MQSFTLTSEFADWLGSLRSWHTFSTWSFSTPISVTGALYWANVHLEHVADLTARRIGLRQPVEAAVFTERGRNGGLVHLHGLIAHTDSLPCSCGARLPVSDWGRDCCLRHSWPCGYARVLPYDPAQGAGHYVAKYISKTQGEWDLVGFSPGRRRRRSVGGVDVVRSAAVPRSFFRLTLPPGRRPRRAAGRVHRVSVDRAGSPRSA